VIAADPRVRELEEIDVSTSDWDGPVLRYMVADIAVAEGAA
jgi:hypothetical protein